MPADEMLKTMQWYFWGMVALCFFNAALCFLSNHLRGKMCELADSVFASNEKLTDADKV